MFLLLLVPSLASADTFSVNTTNDGEPGEAPCANSEECSLRDAIERANETPEADVIKFEVAGTIKVEGSMLPEITSPVEIDGTSAPGYSGTPVVLLDGDELSGGGEDGPDEGLVVAPGGEGTVISGMAIGGFEYGIWFHAAKGAQLCASYVGVEPDGTSALPNLFGVEASSTEVDEGEPSVENEFGADCGALGGNLISGNEEFGVIDRATNTQIAANRIGVDAMGGALPNGRSPGEGEGEEPEAEGGLNGAGIVERETADDATIRGNVIAHNNGAGVEVESVQSEVKIRANSIFENSEGGIVFTSDEPLPPPPTIEEAFQASDDSTTITGEVTSEEEGGEEVSLDFFASESCGGGGEGQTYLGSADVVGGEGSTPYEVTVAATPPNGEEYITATATGSATGATSEFSNCEIYAPERTFTVTALEDGSHGECASKCSLRDAIEAADKTRAFDTIDFAGSAEGAIELSGQLPAIIEPVLIDGTSAPEYEGEPVVAIDGRSSEYGLQVEGSGEAVIKGLAIGNAAYALYLGGEGHSQVCSSWFGVGLEGHALASGNGIFVKQGSPGNEIGVDCGAVVAPNVMAGNSSWGIEDFGDGTEIGGNLVGISPEGGVDPNGAGGIRIAEGARNPVIGGDEVDGAPGPNEVAYNKGPGVLVAEGAARATIRANSIFSNEGKGIEIVEQAPAVPTIEAVESVSGGISVKGSLTAGEEEPVELDVFASAVCESSTPQGELFLGEGEIEESVPGANPYTANVAAPPSDDQTYITVTATSALAGRTSEFSECFTYVPPEPEPQPEPEPKHEESKPSPSSPNPTPPPPPGPTPTNGEKVVVVPTEGKVRIKLPGSKKYVSLEELKEIPVGAVIDATKGKVTLTSIGPGGTEQTATFFGGVFKVKQREGSGVVVLELLDTEACPATASMFTGGAFATASSAHSGSSGKLWGSGHGNFRTEGNQGSATVRGTIWLVEDRCNGTTFFRTRRGVVSVRDFALGKTLSLPAGKKYVAGKE